MNQLSTYNGNLSTITAGDININIKTLPEVQLQYGKLTSVTCNVKFQSGKLVKEVKCNKTSIENVLEIIKT